MQNSEKGESKCLVEAARNLAREGIVTEPIAYDTLHVTLGGKRLCWVTGRGDIGYYKENVADEAAQEMRPTVNPPSGQTRGLAIKIISACTSVQGSAAFRSTS